MLLAMGYDGSAPLIDPFCGSGTIPIEAALIARRMAPGRRRPFAFERWPRFEPATWSKVKHEAEAKVLDRAPAPIVGSDRDAGAIEASRANAMRAGVQGDVTFERRSLSELEFGPPARQPASPPGREVGGWVVTNPALWDEVLRRYAGAGSAWGVARTLDEMEQELQTLTTELSDDREPAVAARAFAAPTTSGCPT